MALVNNKKVGWLGIGIVLIALVATVVVYFEPWVTPDCTNADPTFTEYKPNEEPYKRKLVQLFEISPDDLHYWVEGYQKVGGEDQLLIHVKGKMVCAEFYLIVDGPITPDADHSDEMAHLIEVEGKGYIGTRIEGLRYSTRDVGGVLSFHYLGHDKVKD